MSMYLSKWEEKALSGELGEAIRIAMEIIVRVGEFCGAQKLVRVSHAHVSGVSIFNIGTYGLEFLEDLLRKGARTTVYTTANPASLAIASMGAELYPRDVVEAQRRIVRALISMGIDPQSFTCAPYLLRKPRLGEHLAWAESSAVIIANSVFGARTNREGGLLALAAAIVGRTYEAGMHLEENRVPTELIDARSIELDSVLDASLLGLAVGRATKGVPYIVASRRLDFENPWGRLLIKNLLASIATTSSCSLAIIEGVYPERVDTSSLVDRIAIDRKEIESVIEGPCSSSLALIGCPHVDGEELLEIARRIAKEYRGVVNRVLVTLPSAVDKRFVDAAREVLESAGIEVVELPSCCLVVSDLRPLTPRISTPHGKALHYIPKLAGVEACAIRV